MLLLACSLMAIAPVSAPATIAQGEPLVAQGSSGVALSRRFERASELVSLLLRRNYAGAAAYLRAHARPGSIAAKMPDREVQSFSSLLSSGGFELVSIVEEPGGMVVAEVKGPNGARMAVLFDLETAAPYRIKEVWPGPTRQPQGVLSGQNTEHPGAPQPERELRPEEKIPGKVEVARSAPVPLRFVNGRPFVAVTIEGKGPFWFQVELGEDDIVLSPEVAAAVGDKLKPLTNDNFVKVGNRSINSIYHVNELRIGDATMSDFSVRVEEGIGTDGMLGLSFFKSWLVTLDYPRHRMMLNTGSLPEANGKDILSLRRIFGPYVGIDLTIDGTHVPSLIDTQSSAGLMISPKLAEGFEFENGPVRTGTAKVFLPAAGAVDLPIKAGRLAGNFNVGKYRLQKEIVTILPRPPQSPRLGNIGTQILDNFTVTLDVKNGRMRLARPGPAILPPPPPLRTVGLRSRVAGGKITITEVTPGGPADKAGLKVGDVVIAAGGRSAAELTWGNNSGFFSELARTATSFPVKALRDGQPVGSDLRSEIVVE